jgi:hypothetical protein
MVMMVVIMMVIKVMMMMLLMDGDSYDDVDCDDVHCIMYFFNAAQPALLYLVPACIG